MTLERTPRVVRVQFSAARLVAEGDRPAREGRFTGWQPELLVGRDISDAVPGLGHIAWARARARARKTMGFGMEVLFVPRPPAHRPVGDDELGEFAGHVRQVR